MIAGKGMGFIRSSHYQLLTADYLLSTIDYIACDDQLRKI